VNAEIIESGFDFCIRHHDPLKCENRNLTIGPRARKVLLQLNANSVNLSSAIGVSGKAQSALCITGGYGETGRRYILDIPFNNHPARTGPRWHARRAFPSLLIISIRAIHGVTLTSSSPFGAIVFFGGSFPFFLFRSFPHPECEPIVRQSLPHHWQYSGALVSKLLYRLSSSLEGSSQPLEGSASAGNRRKVPRVCPRATIKAKKKRN
jgi:hypothetical protein